MNVLSAAPRMWKRLPAKISSTFNNCDQVYFCSSISHCSKASLASADAASRISQSNAKVKRKRRNRSLFTRQPKKHLARFVWRAAAIYFPFSFSKQDTVFLLPFLSLFRLSHSKMRARRIMFIVFHAQPTIPTIKENACPIHIP